MSSKAKKPAPPPPAEKLTLEERIERWFHNLNLRWFRKKRLGRQVAREVYKAKGKRLPRRALKVPIEIVFEIMPYDDGAVLCYPYANGVQHRVTDPAIVALVHAAYRTMADELKLPADTPEEENVQEKDSDAA